MKLKIQFDPEIHFDLPIRCQSQTGVLWSPGIRDLWKAVTVAGRPKPVEPD